MAEEINVQGMLTRDQLTTLAANGEIDTVLVAFPDMYGRLIGKRYDADYFLASADHGMHFCNYLLACDMEMDTVPGYDYASWAQGYGDDLAAIDWTTLRHATWLDRSALVLCDVHSGASGETVAVAPRAVLQRQIEHAAALGYTLAGASELEFFVFNETYSSAHEKKFDDLKTFGTYIEDYHLFQGTKVEGLIGAIRRHLKTSGIPVEFSKGEWGPGQHEINLRYSDLITASDRTVIFKQLAKEVAHDQELTVTFMAKWDEAYAGNSQHIHLSLWGADGQQNLFSVEDEFSDLFRWFMGGLLRHARAMTLFFAPIVNSYKRFQAESFAPTGIAWSRDNRTSGFRIVGQGSSLRVECRIPGADSNPYLVFAALLASGLDGIENQIEPPPIFTGDVYTAGQFPHVPGSLREAIEEFEKSDLARQAFGDDVMAHYLHFARTEQRKFDEIVTGWERARYFERI